MTVAGAAQNLTFEDLARLLKERGVALAGLSFRKPLQTVAFLLGAEARRCFDEGRAPDGTPWAPLKNPSRRRGGASAKPLRDTGMLMASLTGRAGGHVEEVTDTALVWGTNVAYAGYHQGGTRTIPARPFLGITPRMQDKIVMILFEHVNKALGG